MGRFSEKSSKGLLSGTKVVLFRSDFYETWSSRKIGDTAATVHCLSPPCIHPVLYLLPYFRLASFAMQKKGRWQDYPPPYPSPCPLITLSQVSSPCSSSFSPAVPSSTSTLSWPDWQSTKEERAAWCSPSPRPDSTWQVTRCAVNSVSCAVCSVQLDHPEHFSLGGSVDIASKVSVHE